MNNSSHVANPRVTSPHAAKWRQIIAVFLAALMLFVSVPLVAIADTVRGVDQFRQGIFRYPAPADFGFADLEVGEAFTAHTEHTANRTASLTNQDFASPNFPSNNTTPTITTTTAPPSTETTTAPDGSLDSNYDEGPELNPDLRYPLVLEDEVDPELAGLGDPIEVGQFHKTFRVGQDSYRTMITTDPNYFYTSSGTTLTVDTELEPASLLFANDYLNPAATLLDVRLPVDLEEDEDFTASFLSLGQALTLTQADGDFTRPAHLENAVLYNDVFEDVDVEFRTEAEFTHIAALLREPTDFDTLTFEIDSHGLVVEKDEGAILFFDSQTEEIVYVLTAPLLMCTTEEMSLETTVSLENTGGSNYTLTLGLDTDWLASEDRIFPVSLNIQVLSERTTENSSSTSRTVTQRRLYGGRAHAYVGNMRARYLGVAGANDFGFARHMIYFWQLNNVNIPPSARIDSAHLRLRQVSNRSNGAMRIEAHRLFYNWNQRVDTITWNQAVSMRREPTSQGPGFTQQSRIGYQHFDVRTAIENVVTNREVHHGFQLRARNEAHSVSGFATDRSNPRANPGFQESWRPRVIINWTPEPQANPNFPLNGTRGRVTPMVQNSRFGQINTVGTFVYGMARPDALVDWRVNICGTNTNPQTGTTLANRSLIYPDSRDFENMLGNPSRLSVFSGRRQNWQTGTLFLNPQLNTYYYYHFRARQIGGSTGRENRSDRFIVYRVTGWDTLASIGRFYNVPVATIAADNRTPDMLIRQGNTLFLRNPRIVNRHFTSPTTPNRSMQAQINNLLNGQGKNAIFSLDPVNLNTGNLWIWEEDFSVESLGADFTLKRDYNSLRADVMSPFGRGWSFGFDEFLVHLENDYIAYNRGNGSILEFVPVGNSFRASFEGHHYDLSRIQVGTNSIDWGEGPESYNVYEWQIRTEAGETRRFDRHGQLRTITDYRGRVTTLERDRYGIISAIVDPSGLRYNITTDVRGRITQIALPTGGTLRYTYDANDNMTSFTNASGRTYRYTYDTQHRMISWINPNGTVMIQDTFDNYGRVTRQVDGEGGVSYIQYVARHANGVTSQVLMTDALGNEKRVFMDNQGRKIRVEHPDGSYEVFAYTNGNPTTTTDRAGNTTSRTFNARGDVISEIRADGAQATWSYNARGQVTGHVDFCGLHTVNTYDGQGNLTQINVNGITQQTFTHDSLGRVLTQTDALGNATQFTYTGTNPEPATQTDALGNTTTFTYNLQRNLTATTDPLGNTARNTFDAQGNITSEADFTGALMQYGFTPAGSTSSITDARGFTTNFTYSPWGYMEGVTDALGNTFTKTYDYLGNQLSITNPLGHTTYFEHDEMGNVIAETDPLGNTTIFELDGNENVISTTDALGNTEETIYCTITEVPIKRIDALGHETHYTLDVHGRVLEEAAPNGATTTFEYDDFGRLVSETSPLGLITEYEYNAAGWLVRESTSEGAETAFEHDALGRVISSTDQYGNTRNFEHDAVGNITREEDTLGNAIYFEHDAEGRVLSQTDALGNTTETVFDEVGNEVLTRDAYGNETRTIYDAVEQVVGTIDARGAQTKTIFDSAGRAVQEIDALGNVTTFTYDAADRLTASTDALGHATTFELDALGNVTKETDPRGAITLREFDGLSRETTTTLPEGLQITRAFDEVSNIVEESNSLDITTTHTFDYVGNLLSTTNALDQEITFEYDIAGNLISETDLRGNTTTHTFDTLGNLTSSTCEADGETTLFTYDSEGRQIEREDAFGRTWTTEYDEIGQVIATTNPLDQTTTFEFDALGRQVKETNSSGVYTESAFDEMGNAVSQTDERGYTTYFEHDLLGRVITLTQPNGAETATIYDAVGNVERIRDPLRRVTHLTHDEVGNQTSTRNPEGG
ncbi:MAG: DUF6531 domain-containing protein, partial [Coriobacteriia bacterium]|nr:DUF6531 domain-containing protein [Coriobacteriia bacterium]MCL2870876.1 DUF6531 domain-containing protein [Coriobacteriia bacterium]